MKILVTGANGFLGYYLTELLLSKGFEVIATGKGDSRLPFEGRIGFRYASMDFTDPFAVHDVFDEFKPQAIVHAGAMTRVDECELRQWDAYLTNVEGTVNMLLNAEEYKAFFVFVSTDFVFDGVEGMYSESDEPDPVNYYGKTKVSAEEAVIEYEYGWAIARTILVYGKPITGGANLLTVVKEKLEKKEPYKLVTDQVRTPTWVGDLAKAIVLILEKKARGIYHISGKEVLTPYEMGCRAADHLHLDKTLLIPVTAEIFTQPAARPAHTGFNLEKARKELGFEPVSFEEGLKLTFRN